MAILSREGFPFFTFSLNNLFKGYYLPPKRHLNFEFFKGFLVGKKKVSHCVCAGIHFNLYIATQERTSKGSRCTKVRRVQSDWRLVAVQE